MKFVSVRPATAARTLARLRARQLVNRLRRRAAQRAVEQVPEFLAFSPPWNGGPYGQPPGWPTAPTATIRIQRDLPSKADLTGGTWRFVGEDVDLGWLPRWSADMPSMLWAYHLHYFDWAWELLAADIGDAVPQTLEVLDSWREAHAVGSRPAWDPYPTALRAWNLCGLDHALQLRRSVWFRQLLDQHARLLRLTLEQDLGGNHLLAELKALIGLSIWSADQPGLERAFHGFIRVLRRQVLADGGHEERSPVYHARVLADVDDVIRLTRAAGVRIPNELLTYHTDLRRWLTTMLTPSGGTPRFNDGDHYDEAALLELAGDPTEVPVNRYLAASEFAVLRPATNIYLAIDTGSPGPHDQPGHAHAGVGSFELWINDDPVFRNTGSSTYAAGERRSLERSSRSQNVATWNDQDQSELWGAFRVGRSPSVRTSVQLKSPPFRVIVKHNGFRDSTGRPIIQERQFDVSSDAVRIIDRFLGKGSGRATSRLHTSRTVTDQDVRSVSLGGISVRWEVTGPTLSIRAAESLLAEGLGVTQPGTSLSAEAEATLPFELSATIRWALKCT